MNTEGIAGEVLVELPGSHRNRADIPGTLIDHSVPGRVAQLARRQLRSDPLPLAGSAGLVAVLGSVQSLAGSMSDYLIREVGAAPNVEVRCGVQMADGAVREVAVR